VSETFSVPAPAKLNLFLHITGRRADGYHTLQTLFRLLDHSDTLHFTPNSSGQVRLRGPDLGIPERDNLVVRAARLLRSGDLGVDIALEKRIPAGGGLGGGSSDAATTLLALNHLWGLGLARARLCELGAGLGADVPVFVAGHTAWAEGVGELLTPVELPEEWYLVVAPQAPVSTAEIFSHRELTRNTAPIKIAAFFEGHTRNDCQELVRRLYPEVDKALTWLEKFGDARLTGTGGCAFCGFPNEEQARSAQARIPGDMNSFVARGLNESPVLQSLASRTD